MSETNDDNTAARPRRAVVLGGGMAGMLAAAVLVDHADEVVVVERDRMPERAEPRKGLPQARHAHLLLAGGARAVEALLPGVTERWLAAGARRVPLPNAIVSLSAQGWIPRTPERQFLISCSRDLLDLVVRRQVLALPGVTLREDVEARGLTGDARRVTGVRIGDAGDGDSRTLRADIVVDATGRGSRAPRWLAELGLPAVREETVDSGLVYASRVFRAPPGAEDFPMVSVAPLVNQAVPGQGITMHPIEGGRWLATVSGTRGGEPSRDAARFEPFARALRHPIAADIIARAEPLTDVHLNRSTVNRRRYFERLNAWPAGFVVTGDAVAAYNPIYGHGMSVAALGALALRGALAGRALAEPGTARAAQRAVARTADAAWAMAAGEDIHYPGAVGERPPAAARLLRGYIQRMMRTGTVDRTVTAALMDVMTLSAPVSQLFTPAVALRVARGPRRPPPQEPPITAAELALAGLARH
ncbi:NAD(P)/FAD-dependent oxidoreductase [Streptomyces sp. NPDC053048]|uniref:NAD(P)/FAD-dependent oxidoreductase n=1 Tax=Streptomyces sp. NPDC053048 TaxID=3365694 RepID=UPI0037D892C6